VDELSAPGRSPALRFGPDRRITGLFGVGVLGAIILALAASDKPGHLIFALAAIVLAGYAAADLLFWPRLAADVNGLRIRTPFARVDLRWSEVEDVRADARMRYGLRSTTLEVDAGATLVVFSRRALGADPAVVQDLVRALAPRR
jgi:hypothetical protein